MKIIIPILLLSLSACSSIKTSAPKRSLSSTTTNEVWRDCSYSRGGVYRHISGDIIDQFENTTTMCFYDLASEFNNPAELMPIRSKETGKCGYVNKHVEIMGNGFEYDYCEPFDNSEFSRVQKNYKWALIDKNAHLITSFWDNIHKYGENTAVVSAQNYTKAILRISDA